MFPVIIRRTLYPLTWIIIGGVCLFEEQAPFLLSTFIILFKCGHFYLCVIYLDMKIFVVLHNYSGHDQVSSGTLRSKDPIIYLKPDSALLKDHKPFFVPDNLGEIRFCAELVVRISRLGKSVPARFAHRYYDAVTVGVNFIAADLQKKLSEKGLPWEKATGFDCSAVLGDWTDKENFSNVQTLRFSLKVNDGLAQESYSSDMIHTVDELVSSVSTNFTLKTGDLLFTGCPVELMPAHINDRITGYLEDRKVLEFYQK